MQSGLKLVVAASAVLAAGWLAPAWAAAIGEPVSAFAANVGEKESGAETPASVTVYVVPDGRTFLLTDVLVANHMEEVGPLYLSDSNRTRCAIALLQSIYLPGNAAGISSYLNVQSTFSTGIPFGPGEPVIATLTHGTRGVDITITGRLVRGPHREPMRFRGGARDDAGTREDGADQDGASARPH